MDVYVFTFGASNLNRGPRKSVVMSMVGEGGGELRPAFLTPPEPFSRG